MNAYQYTYTDFSGMTMDEYSFLHHASAGLTQNQMQTFMLVYNSRRKNPNDILLGILPGFLGLAGVQRFMVKQYFRFPLFDHRRFFWYRNADRFDYLQKHRQRL
jgi:hypothetical protein